MNKTEISQTPPPLAYDSAPLLDSTRLMPLFLFVTSLLMLILSFSDGLAHMVDAWQLEEYSHGYMIPMVALFLFAKQIPAIQQARVSPSATGLVFLGLGLLLLFLGELSSLFTLIQYGFLLALVGLLVVFLGTKASLAVWAALVYLSFMIPLPTFFYNNLSSQLQLASSSIGVSVIRLFDISVFLEGNVIDLGSYKLQVVEACSGLRYLFPLMSFGFLIAYLYKAPLWQRGIIFLSTIPITVLMNSFRIGVIGITVNYWGTAAADGFLHDFEGWVIFLACLGVLAAEIWLLSKLTRLPGTLSSRLDVNLPEISKQDLISILPSFSWQHLAFFLMVVLSIPPIYMLDNRQEIVPDRIRFTSLPLIKGDWIGRESHLDGEIIDTLNVTDYIMANYTRKEGGLPVNFYVAYYHSQRKGSSIHSPRACIPGGGWRITSINEHTFNQELGSVPLSSANTLPEKVNRVVIEKGENKSLVYYWFQQRGRTITNEYLAKWYLFWDGLTMNRTDGALMRISTPVPEGMDIREAEEQLMDFLSEFNPILSDYIPD